MPLVVVAVFVLCIALGSLAVSLPATISRRAIVTKPYLARDPDSAQHEVLVGTDPDALAPVATVDDPAYTASVDLDSTVYWQINEINDAMDPAVWEGNIWTLDTAGTITVDDMETYASREGSYVWETWTDGFEDDTNGALLGHQGDDMETDVFYDGSQSLPYYYGQGGAGSSEAARDIRAIRAEDRRHPVSVTVDDDGGPERVLDTEPGPLIAR